MNSTWLAVALMMIACSKGKKDDGPAPGPAPGSAGSSTAVVAATNGSAATVPTAAAGSNVPVSAGSSTANPAAGGSAVVAQHDCEPDSQDGFVSTVKISRADGKYVAKNGDKSFGPYEMIFGFTKQGIAGAVIDGRLSYIDTEGNVISAAYSFDNGPDEYQEGKIRFRSADGKVGFLGADHAVAIAVNYSDAMRFCKGLATVQRDGEEFEINDKGEPVSARRKAVARSHHD